MATQGTAVRKNLRATKPSCLRKSLANYATVSNSTRTTSFQDTVTASNSTRTTAFQDGVLPSSSYSGTRDTTIDRTAPNTNYGDATTLRADGDDGTGKDVYALLRWGSLTI